MISDKKKAAINAIDEFKRDILNHLIDACNGNDYSKLSLLTIGDIIEEQYKKHRLKYIEMTYKEYYSTLNSIEEVKCAAADDIIVAQVINPDRIDFILNAANEVLKEKFSYEVPELPSLRK